ncbi:hypothetical protein TWF481_010390 [Arthrobotrys musiformis]|uniref:Uncharacterized protein n=2 Tax=Arthrobotrys musiformis TaxID=47236 RepID=A0AAV9W0R3_9PEZI
MSMPPTVSKPRLPHGKNFTTKVVQETFNDQYWMLRTGNWVKYFPIGTVLTKIQEICEILFDEYQSKMLKDVTFQKQSGVLKNAVYARFFVLLEESGTDSEYQSLILEMFQATECSEDEEGHRWLFEYCMRRVWNNRFQRAKAKDPKAKKRSRGAAHYELKSREVASLTTFDPEARAPHDHNPTASSQQGNNMQ